jgi:D-aminopeptidase
LNRPRAREAGVRFGDLPTGPRNMLSDVPGVKVGHSTIIRGSGPLKPGSGPVRTGVTAILPHDGNTFQRPVKGAYFDFNGCGGLGGALQIREFGIIDTPIMLTNTMSMGAVADATIRHMIRANPSVGITADTIIPIVSECDDSYLNDAQGLHVREEHVFGAIDGASQTVHEGAVGAGTGMSCYSYKGGIGTSSRIVQVGDAKYNLGSLVLTNHGDWNELQIDGVPVGSILGDPDLERSTEGSIVMVVGTDAPLDARQLLRISRRAIIGLGATGTCSHNGSGDIVLAFSTANSIDRFAHTGLTTEHFLKDSDINPLFRATVDSVSESIINSLFKAETMEGRDGHISRRLPVDKVLEIMKEHGRLVRHA